MARRRRVRGAAIAALVACRSSGGERMYRRCGGRWLVVALGAAAALGMACGGGGSGSSGGVHRDSPVGGAPIVINELLAANVLTNQDDHGAASGWIELF